MFRTIGKLAVVASLVFAGVTGAEAFPVATGLTDGGALIQPIQHRPGFYKRQFYRREMRRYRGNPGARFELRQNRRAFCRGAPSRC